MVDKLRSSLENLEPPECPTCKTPMGWYSSQLVEYSPVVIEHRFSCSTCGTVIKRSDVRPEMNVAPPTKLSRRHMGRAA